MQILSHRGYWKTPQEKNQAIAFARSFDLGYGTETDVRDCAGQLLMSHDMPNGSEMSVGAFARMVAGRNVPLAINIKADGLAQALKKTMEQHAVPNWFVFDMSVPDTRAQLKAGNRVFTRMSEVEQNPVYLEEAAGVWLDGFDGMWFNNDTIRALLGRGKQVCVVSADLHGRPNAQMWAMLRQGGFSDDVMLCTDVPEDASAFFSARNT